MNAIKAGWRRVLRSALARDVTLALVVKVMLLAALMTLLAHRNIRPANDAAATAVAVAGVVVK